MSLFLLFCLFLCLFLSLCLPIFPTPTSLLYNHPPTLSVSLILFIFQSIHPSSPINLPQYHGLLVSHQIYYGSGSLSHTHQCPVLSPNHKQNQSILGHFINAQRHFRTEGFWMQDSSVETGFKQVPKFSLSHRSLIRHYPQGLPRHCGSGYKSLIWIRSDLCGSHTVPQSN